MIKTVGFYDKLVRLNVKRTNEEVPKLTKFLSYNGDSSLIEVKRLVSTIHEFLLSAHLKSFGTTKTKKDKQLVEETLVEPPQTIINTSKMSPIEEEEVVSQTVGNDVLSPHLVSDYLQSLGNSSSSLHTA